MGMALGYAKIGNGLSFHRAAAIGVDGQLPTVDSFPLDRLPYENLGELRAPGNAFSLQARGPIAVGTSIAARAPHRSRRAQLTHRVRDPAPAARLPGSEPGACWVAPRSPWPAPFAPSTPRMSYHRRSSTSSLLRSGLTAARRAAAATTVWPSRREPVKVVDVQLSRFPAKSFCTCRGPGPRRVDVCSR